VHELLHKNGNQGEKSLLHRIQSTYSQYERILKREGKDVHATVAKMLISLEFHLYVKKIEITAEGKIPDASSPRHASLKKKREIHSACRTRPHARNVCSSGHSAFVIVPISVDTGFRPAPSI